MSNSLRTVLAVGCMIAPIGQAIAQSPKTASDVIAIDVLLAPDAVMMGRAKEANAKLRADYPNGFVLDATHAPHVSVIQRFVRKVDLEKVYAAVAKVLKEENPTTWELKAKGYYDIPFDNLGLAGIVIEPTPELLRLQQKLIDAIAPFTTETATAEAFALRPDGKTIAQAKATIDYVATFVPNSSGDKYNPHVTIGLATRAFLDKLKSEPFESFTFRSRAVEVYHLGEFGTAQNLLWSSAPNDPLPSWNEGPAKKSILDFVEKTTKEGSPDFVPPSERIAVFDNDGTLWPEDPVPFQLAYVIDELKRRSPNEPKLAEDPMVQAALAGDLGKLLEGKHHDGLLHILALTHSGMTTDEFKSNVEKWIATAKHPRFGKRYDQLTYQPMQEVLKHLRANGFKTFIVSGGGADFMRVWAERVYGIPPEQVVGSTALTKFELRESGPVLVKTMEHAFVDDKEGKPVGIHEFIGRRPIACFGNSDGDHAMLQYTTIKNPKLSFGLIVHHTDAEREYAYDAHPKSSGKLVEALEAAPTRGWTVVDMKKDWKVIFAPE